MSILTKVLVRFTYDNRSAVVIDWSIEEAQEQVCFCDPHCDWKNAKIEIIIDELCCNWPVGILEIKTSVKSEEKKMSNSKFRELHVAVHNLMGLLFDSGYEYGGEKMAKEKMILESQHIARINSHSGYVFDAQKISQSAYDRKQMACYALSLIKMMLNNPNYMSEKYTLLVNTTDGIYSIPCEVQITESLGHIRIKAKSPMVLKDITVLGYKILESYGLCIRHIAYYMPSMLVPGDYLYVDCNII